MKGEFKRKVTLDIADIYAVIGVKEERKDIQEYLNSERTNAVVNKYLTAIGLLNARNDLTKQGHELIESNSMFHEEEGKYRIWFVREDDLTGKKILFLRREKYENESKLDAEIEIAGHHSIIYGTNIRQGYQDKGKVVSQKEEIIFKDVERKCRSIGKQQIGLVWEWELNEKQTFPIQTQYFYEGSIPSMVDKLDQFSFQSDFSSEDFKLMLKVNGYSWNEELSKIQIDFEEVNYSTEEWKNFRINKLNLKEKDFGKGKFDLAILSNVNVMPMNEEHADNWRNYLVYLELKKDYCIEEKFSNLLQDLTKKDSFAFFSLPEKSAFDHINQLKPNRNKKLEEYFHLSAPFDLNPFSFETKPILSFTIVSGDSKSYQEVCSQLQSPGKSIEKIIYSDRYIRTDDQKKSFLSLLDVFKNNNSQRITLFTQTNEFLEEEKSNFEIILTEKNWDTHERILVLVYTDGTKDLWKFSRGIDFIQFGENASITKDTKGKTQNCTFVKLEETSVESYIKEKF